ncbi:Por secretion system C-terminal sorting domain-containing protein [Spirosomataceae bacterium TFI 002]|nr:Por secretion system C-terminal sorting domain-containing protein [Spirosomataceae bacterium TFI 002]
MKRRSFLKTGLNGVFLPSLLGGLSIKAFGRTYESTMLTDKVLVVVQLNGGNDGLNTVVPIDIFNKYQAARPNIYIAESKLLRIEQNENLGLHPAMDDIHDLFLNGKAGLIQGVGYPNPNFSHFRATDIWNTSTDSDKFISNGWLGRYLASKNPSFPSGYPNNEEPDPLAIQVGSIVTTALQGPIFSMGMAVSNPENDIELLADKNASYPNSYSGEHLDFINQTSLQTNSYSKRIVEANAKAQNKVDYPDNSLAQQLQVVARLVAGGLKTKIYYVNFGGFDTHANQTNTGNTATGLHANLLETVSLSIGAFMRDLKQLQVSERVMGFTYSEFGRRIKANGSNGTDHGTSAPVFTFGENVNSVVLGHSPDIPSNVGTRDNLPMQYDFRSVYASILSGWFCTDQSTLDEVLLKNFQELPLVKANVCQTITSTQPEQPSKRISNYPNPFVNQTKVAFQSEGGHNMIQVFDLQGRLIDRPLDKELKPGSHELVLNTSNWNHGSYFLRFQNGPYQEIRRLIKN